MKSSFNKKEYGKALLCLRNILFISMLCIMLFSSGQAIAITSSSSGGGGGGSVSKPKVELKDPASEIEEEVLDTINKTGEPKINLKKDDQAVLSQATVKTIIKSQKPLTIEKTDLSLKIQPNTLPKDTLNKISEDENIKIEVDIKEIEAEERVQIVSKTKIGAGSGLYDIGSRLIDISASIKNIDDKKEKIKELEMLNQPVEVSIYIGDLPFFKNLRSEDEIKTFTDKLTAVRHLADKNGNVETFKEGGAYDPETQTFTFKTLKLGYYQILEDPNLRKIEMNIDKINALVDSEVEILDSPPVIVEDRTLVPLRFIAEALCADVEWIEETQTVKLNSEGKEIELKIGELCEGLDVPAQIINGRTMVPVRFISECFCADVCWCDYTQGIKITK